MRVGKDIVYGILGSFGNSELDEKNYRETVALQNFDTPFWNLGSRSHHLPSR